MTRRTDISRRPDPLPRLQAESLDNDPSKPVWRHDDRLRGLQKHWPMQDGKMGRDPSSDAERAQCVSQQALHANRPSEAIGSIVAVATLYAGGRQDTAHGADDAGRKGDGGGE
jgi:hypothetical protein